MTRIRANCPDCGDVELTPDDMLVRIAHDDDALVGDSSHYRFTCPTCATTVRKPADDRVVQLLLTGGVPIEMPDDEQPTMAGTGTPAHPEDPPAGRAFTCDDLLDLHLLLERDDWFDALTASLS